MLPAAQAGRRQARDASGDIGRSPSRLTGIRALWALEHRHNSAGESDRSSWLLSARTPHLGHGSAVLLPACPPGMVACVLSLCAPPCLAVRGARTAGSR